MTSSVSIPLGDIVEMGWNTRRLEEKRSGLRGEAGTRKQGVENFKDKKPLEQHSPNS